MLQSATFHHYSNPVQKAFDAAVVIPTTCRPSLKRAVQSIFRQIGAQRIQTLIGIDAIRDDDAVIEEILDTRPAQHAVTVLNLGYSTSIRHGGLHFSVDGGALRTMLTYAANSRYIAYLDDDNWFDETHISRLLAAIQGRDWAFSLRWYVDPATQQPIAVDRWESVGPDEGAFKKKFGGFVDPNCLMFDKIKCPHVPPLWTVPLRPRTPTADRMVFEALRQLPAIGVTGAATAYYVLNPQDENHPIRLGWINALRQEAGDAALTGLTPMSQEWNRAHGQLQR